MKYQLRPILSDIKAIYALPLSSRFQAYLSLLQGGNPGDLALPISGYNPMAKEHIIQVIDTLEKLNAEEIMAETIADFNSNLNLSHTDQGDIIVVLNIADDLHGAWTNRYTTDYESKFKINALVTRRFCAPYFWSSESFTRVIIATRTREYLSRTQYRLQHPHLYSLADHLHQEIYVAQTINNQAHNLDKERLRQIWQYYHAHKTSTEYDLIFNFYYGDEASRSLGYQRYGIGQTHGYDLARAVASGVIPLS